MHTALGARFNGFRVKPRFSPGSSAPTLADLPFRRSVIHPPSAWRGFLDRETPGPEPCMPPHDLPLALFRPPIVLLVEDRPPSRSPTARRLSMLGYEVRGARSGEQALWLVHHYRTLFDLVLASILLPDMDGGMFVERVRTEAPGIRIAWIADFAPIGKA